MPIPLLAPATFLTLRGDILEKGQATTISPQCEQKRCVRLCLGLPQKTQNLPGVHCASAAAPLRTGWAGWA